MEILHFIAHALQLLIFLLLWLLTILSTFVVVRNLVIERCPSRPYLYNFVPFILITCIVFELGNRVEECRSSSPSLFSFFTSSPSVSLWTLNPIQIVASLLGNLVILASKILGRSGASLISSFISDLPWLMAIPSFIILCTLFILFFFLLFGYQFSLGYGLIKITPSGSNTSTASQRSSWSDIFKRSTEKKSASISVPLPRKEKEYYNRR